MLDKHYGVVMMFNALSKELYSIKQGSKENMAEFRMCLLPTSPVGVPGKDSTGACGGDEMRLFLWGPEPWILACWPTKWMANTPLVTPTWFLLPRSWKDRQRPEIPCCRRPPWLEGQMLPSHRHWGTCFPLWSWRAIIPSWLNPPWWKALELKETQMQS